MRAASDARVEGKGWYAVAYEGGRSSTTSPRIYCQSADPAGAQPASTVKTRRQDRAGSALTRAFARRPMWPRVAARHTVELLPILLPGFPTVGNPGRRRTRKGYGARKGNRWYAVIYEGLDPVTGKERRKWHPAGTSREEAEELVSRPAAELNGRNDKVRSLTFGAYLTSTWLPGKKINLAKSTWDGYRRKINRHVIRAVGRTPIRRLRAQHLERLYDQMLHPNDGKRALAPKTVLEVHLIIRAALNDAVTRGLVS
jgi:hypothetical protein